MILKMTLGCRILPLGPQKGELRGQASHTGKGLPRTLQGTGLKASAVWPVSPENESSSFGVSCPDRLRPEMEEIIPRMIARFSILERQGRLLFSFLFLFLRPRLKFEFPSVSFAGALRTRTKL